jgi:multicomponent Na+:H+ antiporter subunit D
MVQSLLHTGIAPSLIFIAGALLVPFFKGRLKVAFMLLLPVLSFIILAHVSEGKQWTFSILDYDLILGRIDRLSRLFGYIFCIAAFIAILFAARVKNDLEHVAALLYVGSTMGVTFAGEFLSLYVFWEIMAIASTFLILAERSKEAQAAAFRYVLIHLFGGLLLLAGIILTYHQTGTMEFDYIGLKGAASYLIFAGILINVGAPPLHAWIKDAYPEATVTGSVFLCVFTTKSAVYLLARTFPGTPMLIYLGALMTVFPVFYAVLENNVRRILAYSLINQNGFMLVGIGLGTALAINGSVSHAFCHIIYKSLLFMSTGSVLYMTGKIKCTDLGGLYKTMPMTCLFCVVAAASISAFPLFSGFVSKSMIISAVGHHKMAIIWLMLQFAAAGIILYQGLRVPYFVFFSEDSGIRTKEPPLNMIIAMALAASLCVFIGIYPQPLYALLPYPDVVYVPYTEAHVVGMLQLLLFGVLAFILLIRSDFYPKALRTINLDTDWFYRKGGRLVYRIFDIVLNKINRVFDKVFARGLSSQLGRFAKDGPANIAALLAVPIQLLRDSKEGRLSDEKERMKAAFRNGTIPIGISTVMVAIFLAVALMLI